MKHTRLIALTCLPAVALLSSCASSGKSGSGGESTRKLDTLASWMAGTYTSEAQASTDPDNYFNVRLIMTPIWTERSDGRWLYVEQAMSTALEKPYRQRIYQVTPKGAGFESVVYTLPGDALEYAGAWQDPSRFDALAPQMLAEREGCEIELAWDAASQMFKGSTVANNCPSDLRGATYATSEVTITQTQLNSWDRGFDASGNQVWGARMGGYQFVKVAR
ncbi:MAG: chromophore lyase CpcT/CpeT [Phycisphaerales bacterium]